MADTDRRDDAEQSYESLSEMPADVLAHRVVGSLILAKGNLNEYKAIIQRMLEELAKERAAQSTSAPQSESATRPSEKEQPTPRTDAAEFDLNGRNVVWPDFARQLERELATAHEERRVQQYLATTRGEALQSASVPPEWAKAIVRYNDNARSFFQIANRVATELGTHALQTNFGGFAEATERLLKETHELTNEARAMLAAVDGAAKREGQ